MGIRKWWHDLNHGNEPRTVNDAFRITKFGCVVSDEKLFKIALADILSLLSIKMQSKAYSLVYDLDEDFPDIGISLATYFRDRGFNVLIIDKNIYPSIVGACLFVSWKQEVGK